MRYSSPCCHRQILSLNEFLINALHIFHLFFIHTQSFATYLPFHFSVMFFSSFLLLARSTISSANPSLFILAPYMILAPCLIFYNTVLNIREARESPCLTSFYISNFSFNKLFILTLFSVLCRVNFIILINFGQSFRSVNSTLN